MVGGFFWNILSSVCVVQNERLDDDPMARHAHHGYIYMVVHFLLLPVLIGCAISGAISGGLYLLVDHLDYHAQPVPTQTPLTRTSTPPPKNPVETIRTPVKAVMMTYTVHSGNTLWGIAATHCGNPLKWAQLWHANEKLIPDPNLIHPNMVINLVCLPMEHQRRLD